MSAGHSCGFVHMAFVSKQTVNREIMLAKSRYDSDYFVRFKDTPGVASSAIYNLYLMQCYQIGCKLFVS